MLVITPQSFISNSELNAGDYVKTSRGNIGIILYPAYWELSSHALIYTIQGTEEDAIVECMRLQDIFPIVDDTFQTPFVHKFIQTRVKIGSKEYNIDNSQLTKLESLNIRTQQGLSQHNIILPIEDAKLLMDIYNRNTIWYAVV